MTKLQQKEIRIKLAKEMERQHMSGLVYLSQEGLNLVLKMQKGKCNINKRELVQ